MKTAVEIAYERAEALQAIPLITHPLGSGWTQPDRSRILIDNEYAMMSTADFYQLAEYSCSNPSGVYEGKMWKRHNGSFDSDFIGRGGKPTWLLVWYGRSDHPDKCSVNSRKILLSDGELPT